MSYLEMGKNGMAFRIGNAKSSKDEFHYQYDNEYGGMLEVNINTDYSEIVSIECFRIGDIHEEKIKEPAKDSIKRMNVASHYISHDTDRLEYIGNFKVVFDQSKMKIIFNDEKKAVAFTETERVDYYYDEEREPLFIIVKDLSKIEYDILRTQSLMVNSKSEEQIEKVRRI